MTLLSVMSLRILNQLQLESSSCQAPQLGLDERQHVGNVEEMSVDELMWCFHTHTHTGKNSNTLSQSRKI